MKLLLVRHGQTTWNAAGRFQGHQDVPLSSIGVAQAEAVAAVLAAESPTRLWCSDLSRASATAAPIGRASGLEPIPDPRLREVDVGSWAGMDSDEIGRLVPDFWPAIQEGRDFRRSPEGETATECGQRVRAAIEDLVAGVGAEETVVIVSHGLALRVATLLMLGLDYSWARRFTGLANCGWIELVGDPSGWRLAGYNRIATAVVAPANNEA